MKNELSLDNILDETDALSLFDDSEDMEETDSLESESENKENKEKTTEISQDELLEELESVGSDKNNHEDGEDADSQDDSHSPNSHFYSSIATALSEEGVFPDLDEDSISKITDAESLLTAILDLIKAGLDEKLKRVDEALNIGVEPDLIRYYENTLSNLDAITEEALAKEDERTENLRKSLIYQDLINRGYSESRAMKVVERSVKEGTDIEDAKDALEANKEFFLNQYNQLLEERRKEAKKAEEEEKQKVERLKKTILDNDTVFGDISIDKATRLKVYDNISKPTFKDKDGKLYTELLKYQLLHPEEYLLNVGILYTLTDGFSNLNKLLGSKVNKEVKKGIKNLENTLRSTGNRFDGKLNFASGVSTEKESFINSGWRADI